MRGSLPSLNFEINKKIDKTGHATQELSEWKDLITDLKLQKNWNKKLPN